MYIPIELLWIIGGIAAIVLVIKIIRRIKDRLFIHDVHEFQRKILMGDDYAPSTSEVLKNFVQLLLGIAALGFLFLVVAILRG